ncbi:hypothetical protein GCM10011414_15650 [Croceivirga lutea]|uniref:YbbR-like domain-containing protein n=1 Tax=Croceivirga lutea TaxID=1775167 RepID=UPI00163AFEA9|nr:YbbR-like domain-containing protein [Croceivirga lutea]GGG46876.1 hypothetical protein GCM10011414_15650 [Croceivirga lutea]
MLRKFINGLDKKKVKVFLLFLALSFVAWSISKLSQNYDSWVTVELEATKLPDSLLLKENTNTQARLRISASGFRLLGMGLSQKTFKVNVSKIQSKNHEYYLKANTIQDQLNEKFSTAIIKRVSPDTLFFDLYHVVAKKVKIKGNLGLKPAQNYILQGRIKYEPDSILVKGPSKEIDTLKVIYTKPRNFENIDKDIEEFVSLEIPSSLKDSEFSGNRVKVLAKVVRFSEKLISVPVTVENVPKGYAIKTFPSTITLLCKAPETALNSIVGTDFKVVAKYDSTLVKSNTLYLSIVTKPESVFYSKLQEQTVKFVLEQK